MDTEQTNFNTNFIYKFLIFTHIYLFFSMYIDQEGIVVKCLENAYNDLIIDDVN